MRKELCFREIGKMSANLFRSGVKSRRIASLKLSNCKDIVSAHEGSINSLQRGDIYYQVHQMPLLLFMMFMRPQIMMKGVAWLSTSVYFQLISNMNLDISMQYLQLYASHMLIAAGTEDAQVRLCDIASGGFAHTLSGHRDCVTAVEWSASSEWVLFSGGCDGAICFWDIRRAGCFLVLDQSQSQLGRRPPLFAPSFTNKVPISQNILWCENMSAKTWTSRNKVTKRTGITQRRLHPGLSSREDHVTAHYGAVIGLEATGDGMYLVSAGSDSRIRFWDVKSGCNTLVNFETPRIQTSRRIQLAAFDVWSGKVEVTFHGHYESVNCCCFSYQDQELYTGGDDWQILVWSPSRFIPHQGAVFGEDKDCWSD